MKKLSNRAYFALILAVALVLGTIGFVWQYFRKAGQWVTFSGSPHVYSGANFSLGTVTDRSGTLLLEVAHERTYSEDPQLRSATMHLLGDRYGYIHAPLLGHYADKMIGYDKINGLYALRRQSGSAQLTVHAEAQKAALTALAGRRGTIGVYNYKTGEILCAVTAPSYDPDHMPDVEAQTDDVYRGVFLNRFFDVTYTPGSIFKLVTTAAALEELEDVQAREYVCEGSCIIGEQNVICNATHGQIGFQDALARSCNCVFGQLAAELGGDALEDVSKRVGLIKPHACDGYVTATGSVELSKAGDGDVAWAGIGQHTDQVSAYAFLRFMGIVGGGGEAAEPHLMAQTMLGDRVTYRARTVSTGRVLDSDLAQTMQQLMRYNVQSVYGDWLFGDLEVCAKSGTAEVEGETANSMFAGFVQDENCPLAFVVFVENGGSGSAVAAPIAGQIVQLCAQLLKST